MSVPVDRQKLPSRQAGAGLGEAISALVDDDVALLHRIAREDREAFRDFHERWSQRLLGILRRKCRRPETAEEVLQEVFLTVWRKASTFNAERGDVGGWLYTICSHRAVDRFRRAPPSTVSLDKAPEPITRRPAFRDSRLDLEDALQRLKSDEREAVEIAYFGGLTYEETARHLGVPLGTLKSRIRSGLRKLATVLSKG